MKSDMHPREKPRPSAVTYIFIGGVLTLVTAVEVAAFYLNVAGSVLVPIFIILSLLKFALVVMFYMHLRYDHLLFSCFFATGVLLAIGVGLAFIALFGNFDIGEPNVMAVSPTPTPLPTSTPPLEPLAGEEVLTIGDVGGSQVFISKGCGACHTVNGLAGAVGSVGPGLDGVATRAAEREPGVGAEEYIRESVIDPGVYLVEGYGALMPPAIRDIMSSEEFDALVEFLLTLK